MNIKQEVDALTNFLRVIDKEEKYLISKADSRLGKRYAITEKTEIGGINVKSNFMTYSEMNAFFMGILTVKENRIIFT